MRQAEGVNKNTMRATRRRMKTKSTTAATTAKEHATSVLWRAAVAVVLATGLLSLAVGAVAAVGR